MRIRNRLMLGVVGASALAIAPGVQAQDISRTDPAPVVGASTDSVEQNAADLVRACAERMAHVARATCGRIVHISWTGVGAMRAAAQEGAPNPVVAEIASETLERMRLTADEGRDHINRIAAECLQRLSEMEASPAHAAAVLGARDRSLGFVARCLRDSGQRVRRAARFLTSDAAPGDAVLN